MLAFAQDYEKELEKKMRGTLGKEKYWYYHNSSFMSPIEIDTDTWNNMQFVSLNPSGEVIGYLGYGIKQQERYVSYLAIINFTDDVSFGLDVMTMIKDIFEKYQYKKIVFSVIIGNPIESTYDRLIRHYGGKVVGVFKDHVMLPDGKLYDEKFYEIHRSEYLMHRVHVNNA